MEHRWGERFKVALPVRIGGACGLAGTGLVIDFSVSGALIATSVPAALLSRVRISFRPGRSGGHRAKPFGAWTLEGHVVRRHVTGFAVEWCEFGTADILRLQTPIVAA